MKNAYTFKELENGKLEKIEKRHGIYKVSVPKDFGEIVLNPKKYKEYDIKSEKIEKREPLLKGKRKVLYIGRAKNLHRRIKQYIKYGLHEADNHKGGRYIFAINGWENLLIEVEYCENYKEREADGINKFKETHNGERPFANLKDGDKSKIKDQPIENLGYWKNDEVRERNCAVNKDREEGVTDIPIPYGMNDRDYDDEDQALYNDEEDDEIV